jgi:hypothetical protein
MSTEWVVIGFVSAALGIYVRRRLAQIERIHVFSRDGTLPWYERAQFEFRLSFDQQADAAAAIERVQASGVSGTTEITPNGRWTAVWRVRARASGAWYRELCERIVATGRALGLEEITVLSSVSDPTGSNHLLLDNVSFTPASAPARPG